LGLEDKSRSARSGFCASGLRGHLRLHEQGQHEAGAGAHCCCRVMAGGLEHLHPFVAEGRLAGGEDGEGFESHGADRSAVFGETSADEREQAHALRAGHCVVRGGNDDVAAGLPFLHRQLSGDLGEDVGAGSEDAGLAAADEAGEFGGTAMVEGIVAAELTEQFADGCFARPGKEVLCGRGCVG
jgi:hypothetical protein